ncbi:MAG: glycosyltransferase, partial [Phycisphaerae bacterium]|nr:glycosyltransferase [Phycisphaerae bacterium]
MTKTLTVVQMLPELESGGVERGTLEIGKYLVNHGHRSIVISGGGRMVAQLKEEGSEHINWEVGKKSLSTLRYIRKVRKFLRETKPDILHLRSRLPAWIGYLAWKKLPQNDRPKLVTTVHGPYTVGKYSSVMMRGEKIIAVSEFTKSQIQALFPFALNKIEVVHEGVEPPEHIPTIIKDKLSDWEDMILCLGTIEPRKNLESAIAAFDLFLDQHSDRAQKTRLVLAGKFGWRTEKVE